MSLGGRFSRRQVFRWLAAAAVVPPMGAQTHRGGRLVLEVPPLPYGYDALEPYIDAETMRIHHDKHHAAYVAGLAKAVESLPQLGLRPLEELLASLDAVPESVRLAVRNHGGGHYNHSLFWQCLTPNAPGGPEGELALAIRRDFGSLESFKEVFTKSALGLFGSGWCWLVLEGGKLTVTTTANQDTPLASGHAPLLGLDLWEHAYYLKYQWRRVEYVGAFWHVVNWPFVGERYRRLRSKA